MSLLALDPGYAEGCGVAIFSNQGILTAAGFVRSRGGGDLLNRCAVAATAVVNWAFEVDAEVDRLVAEWPQIYAASRSKGDPNDLLGLAAVSCAVAAAGSWVSVSHVLPRTWKGTTPKPKPGAEYVIAHRVRERLSATEMRHVVAVPGSWANDNVVDAVGIGLHHLGRLARRRVIPR